MCADNNEFLKNYELTIESLKKEFPELINAINEEKNNFEQK